MPLVSYPTPPDRVRIGHDSTDYASTDAAYSRGYQDAVRQILGEDAWFALRCDLDGNKLPGLRFSSPTPEAE